MRSLLRRTTAVALAALLSIGLWAGATTPTEAASRPAFNKALVITHAAFYDADAMSTAQIKSFIQKKGARCKSNSSRRCLKDITFPAVTLKSGQKGKGCKTVSIAKGSRAWTVIGKVAKACGISPKVIFTTIQKEQGGVTGALTMARWNKLMGMGCPDGGSCSSRYRGLAYQIYYGADHLKAYRTWTDYAAVKSWKYKRTYRSLDGHSFVIKNGATAALYTYTPHVSGQRLFHNIMESFFPGTTSRNYRPAKK